MVAAMSSPSGEPLMRFCAAGATSSATNIRTQSGSEHFLSQSIANERMGRDQLVTGVVGKQPLRNSRSAPSTCAFLPMPRYSRWACAGAWGYCLEAVLDNPCGRKRRHRRAFPRRGRRDRIDCAIISESSDHGKPTLVRLLARWTGSLVPSDWVSNHSAQPAG